MDNDWRNQQIQNEIEAIVLNAILMVLYKLSNEIAAAKRIYEEKF